MFSIVSHQIIIKKFSKSSTINYLDTHRDDQLAGLNFYNRLHKNKSSTCLFLFILYVTRLFRYLWTESMILFLLVMGYLSDGHILRLEKNTPTVIVDNKVLW